MSTLVDTDDIIADLPQLKLTATSTPSLQQVEQYINDITLEVRAVVEGNHGIWPTDFTSIASMFLRRTVLEGVRWLVLRAINTLTGGARYEEIYRADKAYTDRLKMIPTIIVAESWEQPEVAVGSNTPASGPPEFTSRFNETFMTATHRRANRDGFGEFPFLYPHPDW